MLDGRKDTRTQAAFFQVPMGLKGDGGGIVKGLKRCIKRGDVLSMEKTRLGEYSNS